MDPDNEPDFYDLEDEARWLYQMGVNANELYVMKGYYKLSQIEFELLYEWLVQLEEEDRDAAGIGD